MTKDNNDKGLKVTKKSPRKKKLKEKSASDKELKENISIDEVKAKQNPQANNIESRFTTSADDLQQTESIDKKPRTIKFPEDKQALLLQRAKHLAHTDNEDHNSELMVPFVSCRIGEREKYGIAQKHIDEVLYLSEITSVPCAPAFIAGVVNRRSQILPVLDIRQFFSVEKTELNEDARIIVVKNNTMTVGIIINAIINSNLYNSSEVEPALPSDGLTNLAYVQGIYHGDITILNIEALLDDKNILVDNKSRTA